MSIKIFIVAGARPNFMKIAPLIRELSKKSKNLLKYKVIHTGQHYDYEMSKGFLEELKIPRPSYFLDAKGGTHASQTAKIMLNFEKVCLKDCPDLVIVVGDVNSTLACSIVAKKMNITVAHLEAGLRSFDMSMPEEINRIITDRISDYLFVTEKSGYDNLKKEGKQGKNLFFVGNIMIDNLLHQIKQLKRIDTSIFKTDKFKQKLGEYACLTLHRSSNVDSRAALFPLMNVLRKIAKKIPIIFPVHPRTRNKLKTFNIEKDKNIIMVKPLLYNEFLNLWKDSKFVLTDSGGIQEETTVLGIPCFTLRNNTERSITIEKGTNTLIGQDYKKLLKEIDSVLLGESKKSKIPKFWDGKTSNRIVEVIIGELCQK